MPIEFPCPACNSLLRTPDLSAGKKAKCPKCGAIADVPGPTSPTESTQPTAPSPLENPFAESGDSPFVPQKSSESYNPYATPQGVEVGERAWIGSEELAIHHRPIEFGQVFSASWQICTQQLGQCLLVGLTVIGVWIVLQVISQIGEFAGAMTGDLLVAVGIQVVVFLFNMVIQVAIQLGLCIFGIRLARTGRAEVGDLFACRPFLIRGILLTFLLWLIMVGIMFVCAVPIVALVAAFGLERAFEDAPHIVIPAILLVGVAGMVTVIWISLCLLLAMPLIVDRNLGLVDAVRMSTAFMKGNKLTAMLVLMVAGSLAMAITLFTCCLGVIFTYPYLAVVTATIYLAATGQPLQIHQVSHQR